MRKRPVGSTTICGPWPPSCKVSRNTVPETRLEWGAKVESPRSWTADAGCVPAAASAQPKQAAASATARLRGLKLSSGFRSPSLKRTGRLNSEAQLWLR